MVFQGKETERLRSHLELIQTHSFGLRRALHLTQLWLRKWTLTFRSTQKKPGERRLRFESAILPSPTWQCFSGSPFSLRLDGVLFDLTSIPQSGCAVFAQTHTRKLLQHCTCLQAEVWKDYSHSFGFLTSFGIGQGIFEKMNSLFVRERDLILVLPWRITGHLERHSHAHFWFVPAALGSTIWSVHFGL